MLLNHLILCHPLLLLPSIFSSIRVITNESALHFMWSKNWRSSFSISPSNEYSGLISFRIDWFDLLAVQGTLKSLLQYHSSKAPHQGHIEMFGDRILKTWCLSKIIVLSCSFRMYLKWVDTDFFFLINKSIQNNVFGLPGVVLELWFFPKAQTSSV